MTHRLVAEKEEHAMELELTVQRLNDDQVDKDSLLDSMQSDKTALSRAIAQNRELKTQLAELQNGFVKMVKSSKTPIPLQLQFIGKTETLKR